MTRSSKEAGDQGEALAAKHLRRAGYRIIERNYRCGLGEIDIVARQGRCLVFVEVKARRGTGFGSPLDAVDRRKRAKLARLAHAYLAEHRLTEVSVRFDVVGVRLDVEPVEVEVVANAFDVEG